MLNKLLLFLLSVMTFQSGVFAQEEKKDTIPETKGEKLLEKKENTTPETKGEIKQEYKPYNLTQFAHETYLFVKQPILFKGKDWLTIGAIAAVTIAAMPFDERITNSTQGKQRYYYSAPIVGGRIYGEWYTIGGLTAVFGCYGILAHNDNSKKIAIELLQAGLYAEGVTEVLKMAIGRARPLITDNSFNYRPFNINNNYNSMPSGHTTAAMALSTVMSRHANSTWLKILAYVPVGFTMFSRIYQHQHWLSDEIPALAVGYVTGNWVVDLHEGKRHLINVTSMYPATISINLDREPVQK